MKLIARVDYRREYKSIYMIERLDLAFLSELFNSLATSHNFESAANIRETMFIFYLN